MKKSIIYFSLAFLALTGSSVEASNVVSCHSIVHFKTGTPLCTAIQKGELDFVKKLIEYGADVNERSYGMTPLMVAARYNKVDIIKYLLAHGANPEIKDDKGFTAAKYAELSMAHDAYVLLRQY
jgi:hypothetical protein